MFYLAIDQHSKQLTVNVRDESGQVILRKEVSTREDAPKEFLMKLSEQATGGCVSSAKTAKDDRTQRLGQSVFAL